MGRIRKIDIHMMMQILSRLYDLGADYVDLEGVNVEGQDIIRLYFQDSYIDPEYMNDFEDFMEQVGGEPIENKEVPKIEMKKLTSEDLNDLIV